MTLNPRIFNFKRRFKDEDTDIPYALFTVVHEIAHCVYHIEKVSFSKKWQAISGWKKCDINDKIPDGYKRYIKKMLNFVENTHQEIQEKILLIV